MSIFTLFTPMIFMKAGMMIEANHENALYVLGIGVMFFVGGIFEHHMKYEGR